MKRWIVMLVLACLMSSTMFAADTVQVKWYTDFNEAKKEAALQKRPMLVDFTGSDWCGWCIKLDKEVFSRPEFKKYASQNLILVCIDFPRNKWQTPSQKQTNNQLAQKYRIAGFPTILLMNPNGGIIGQTGYKPGGAKNYVNHLKTMLEK